MDRYIYESPVYHADLVTCGIIELIFFIFRMINMVQYDFDKGYVGELKKKVAVNEDSLCQVCCS